MANDGDADPGIVGERLRDHGYAFTECRREHPGAWPALDGHDLVLLLGSEWSVDWPHVAAEVGAELALVRTAHQRGVPLLGICFGHQAMCAALGGTVGRAREPEIGWHHVATDRPEVVAEGPWMQWHADVATAPAGAEEIARNDVGLQAWRLGRSLATQFHPEATESIVVRWASGSGVAELAAAGLDADELLAATRANVPIAGEHAAALVDHFVEVCAGGRLGPSHVNR